jgi:hypothetical protein
MKLRTPRPDPDLPGNVIVSETRVGGEGFFKDWVTSSSVPAEKARRAKTRRAKKGYPVTEDKVSLTRRRAELVESLVPTLLPEDRVRIQGELSIVNAKIKALNTTEAARLKAEANQRKLAGLAEAQANAVRAVARVQAKVNGGKAEDATEDEDDDPGQTAAIDGWIDAVLLRHDVDFARVRGALKLEMSSPQKWTAVVEALVAGVYAVARGQELPDLPPIAAPKEKTKPRKRT